MELPALPVLAPHSTCAPISRARTNATAPARSLNDALGFCPSSFSSRCLRPVAALSRGASYNGVCPTRNGEANSNRDTGNNA